MRHHTTPLARNLVVDGSPDSAREVQAELSGHIRELLAEEGHRYHPQAVRLLQKAALALEIDSREQRPNAAGMLWMRWRHWSSVWFSSAGVGVSIPWYERDSARSPEWPG